MKQGQFPAVLNLADLNGQNGFKLDGSTGEYAGLSVSYAGDINEDGYSDLIIGAPCPNNAGIPGRSYVVFGGSKVGQGGVLQLASLSGAQGFMINGEATDDQNGWCVSYGGDINGDGHTDILINAPNSHRSYAVYGPMKQGAGIFQLSNLNGTNGFRIEGVGYPIKNVGDINSDGHEDLFVSTFVVYGRLSLGQGGSFDVAKLNGTNGFKFVEESSSSGLASGYCQPISGLGDINGDGSPDLAIGASNYPYITASNPPGGPGRSYIVYGSSTLSKNGLFYVSTLNGTNGFKIDGEVRGDASGFTLSSISNFNGKNQLDLLIGTPHYANDTGCVYVIYGGSQIGQNSLLQLSTLSNTQGFKINGEMRGDMAGVFVDSAGDINNDGYNDLIIGAPYATAWGGYSRNYILFGGQGIGKNGAFSLSELNGTNGFKIDGESMNDESGFSVSSIHDFNGDGIDDLIMGAYHYNNGAGRSYVIFGDISPQLWVNQLTLQNAQTITLTPQNLNATDNGPVIFNITNLKQGHFQFVNASGKAITNFTQPQVINHQVQFVHDGSGIAPSYFVQVINSGIALSPPPESAKIIFTPGIRWQYPPVVNLSALNGTNGFKLDGENNQDWSGISVSAAGNINGDSYDDLIIGAHSYPAASSKGRSYVLFGGPGVGSSGSIALAALNGINGFKVDGENNNDSSGRGSTAGDINGDGYDDLLIGASSYPGGYQKGRSYVVFGGPGVGSNGLFYLTNLNGTNGFKMDGENNGDASGFSMSTLRDINGDGHHDLLIGAYGYPPGLGIGRSYVVFGGPGVGGSKGFIALATLNGTNGFKLDGENTGESSGTSVSIAGDINADSYDDLIIGAPFYSNNPSQKGRSYVVFGGPGIGSNGLITLANLTGANGFKLEGENNKDDSGHSVSAAGDINGDGHDDLVIGASGYPGGNSRGCSYVIFGGAGVGGSGLFSLASLNGVNGFKMEGESNGDNSGSSVSAAGDFNGDGYGDLIIGAPYAGYRGCSYVVFGGSSVGKNGLIALGNLSGLDGFKLDGENNNDYSGFSVSAVGDINADGYDDLIIGSPAYPNASFKGRTYVVFGGPYLAIGFVPTTTPAPVLSTKTPTSVVSTRTPTHAASTTFISSPLVSKSTTVIPTPTASAGSFTTGTPTPTTSITPSTTFTSSITSTVVPTPTTSPSATPTFTATPTANFTPPLSNTVSGDNSTSLSVIIGATAGGLAALVALGAGIWCYRQKNRVTLKTLTTQTPEDTSFLPVEPDFEKKSSPRSESYSTQRGFNPASSIELATMSQPNSLDDSKISAPGSSRLSSPPVMDEIGDMKISFGIVYRDLEFDEKDKLGSGAYGTVYRGTYQFNDVAIKQLHTNHLSSAAVDELKLEAGILGSMRSNYIVQLQGICLEAPHYCLVMELMPKGSLYSVLQNSPELPLSVRYQIGLDVCYGLYHLHEKNILHRDLKSLNVLL